MIARRRSCRLAQRKQCQARAIDGNSLDARQNLPLYVQFGMRSGDAKMNVDFIHLDHDLPRSMLAADSQCRRRLEKAVEQDPAELLTESVPRWRTRENTDAAVDQSLRRINQALRGDCGKKMPPEVVHFCANRTCLHMHAVCGYLLFRQSLFEKIHDRCYVEVVHFCTPLHKIGRKESPEKYLPQKKDYGFPIRTNGA